MWWSGCTVRTGCVIALLDLKRNALAVLGMTIRSGPSNADRLRAAMKAKGYDWVNFKDYYNS